MSVALFIATLLTGANTALYFVATWLRGKDRDMSTSVARVAHGVLAITLVVITAAIFQTQ